MAAVRHEEDLCLNFAMLVLFVKFMLFSENTILYYKKLDKVHFFLNAFISPDIFIFNRRARIFGIQIKKLLQYASD